MSYTIAVQNSSNSTIQTGDGKTIKPGESWKSPVLGNTYLHSEEFGSMSFIDIAKEHIGGDTGESWGVLITYQGSHMVGRYEGGGQLRVTFDKHLQAVVGGMDLRHVQLTPLLTEEEAKREHVEQGGYSA